MYYITENKKLQAFFAADGMPDYQKIDYFTLAVVALLGQAAFELSDSPIKTLSHLHGLISRLYEQGSEQEAVEALGVIYGLLGSEYGEQITQFESSGEAQGYFLYGFIANLGEFIEELT